MRYVAREETSEFCLRGWILLRVELLTFPAGLIRAFLPPWELLLAQQCWGSHQHRVDIAATFANRFALTNLFASQSLTYHLIGEHLQQHGAKPMARATLRPCSQPGSDGGRLWLRGGMRHQLAPRAL